MNHLSDRELSCVSDLLRNMTSEIGELVILGLREPEVSRIKEHLTQLGKQYLKESRSPARQCRYDMTPDERRQSATELVPQDETGLVPQDKTEGASDPLHEQRSQVAHLVGRIHGLKFMVEQTLRDEAGGELPYDVKVACESLDDAADYLNDVLKRLVAQKSRNLMDLLGQAHEGK